MNNKRPLSPGFLNKLDNYLLLNKPAIWSTRVHLVVYYGILFMATLTLLGYVFPDDPRNESSADFWLGVICIISFIAFITWLIFLLRFNVFKRYGNISPAGTLLDFILYFIATGTIVLFSYVYPYVESDKANRAYTDDEIVNDINAINNKICQIEYRTISHKWSVDTIVVVKDALHLPSYLKHSNDEDNNYVIVVDSAVYVPSLLPGQEIEVIDTSALKSRLQTDSSQKINDSLYLFYNVPHYTFLEVPYINSYASRARLSDWDIYKANGGFIYYKSPNTGVIQKELAVLIAKYTKGTNHSHNYDSEAEPDITMIINKKYDLTTVESSMNNIISRKHSIYRTSAANIFRSFYYITLALTLLIFVYRHSTNRTFFFTFLSAFIIMILSIMLGTLLDFREPGFFVLIFSLFILFLLLASRVWTQKTRTIVTGISINIFVLSALFMPALAVACYIYVKNLYVRDTLSVDKYENFNDWQLIIETGTPVILLILIATYVHGLYRKWYSLPTE